MQEKYIPPGAIENERNRDIVTIGSGAAERSSVKQKQYRYQSTGYEACSIGNQSIFSQTPKSNIRKDRTSHSNYGGNDGRPKDRVDHVVRADYPANGPPGCHANVDNSLPARSTE